MTTRTAPGTLRSGDGEMGATTAFPRVDGIIAGAVLLLAALPFGQVVQRDVGPALVTLSEAIYLFLLVALSYRIVLWGRAARLLPVALAAVTIGYTLLDSLIFRGANTDFTVYQLRQLLPFLTALLLLLSGSTFSFDRLLMGFVVAGLCSSLSALIIHYFYPGFLLSALQSNPYYVALTGEEGRLYWPNATIAFMCIIATVHLSLRQGRIALLPVLATTATLVALFATLNRTLIVGLVAFLALVLWRARLSRAISGVLLVLSAVLLTTVVVSSLVLTFSPAAAQSAALRFFGSQQEFEPSSIYTRDFLVGRVPLYSQYVDPPMALLTGKGFGTPFAVGETRVYITTDISALSFTLLFGMAGLLLFVIFIVYLFRAIPRESDRRRISPNYMLKALLIVSLMVSLNVDIFSRDSFVVFLTLAIVSLRHGALEEAGAFAGIRSRMPALESGDD